MPSISLPLAHAGHVEAIMMLMPVLVLALALAVVIVRDRWHRRGARSDRLPGTGDPEV